MSCVQWRRTFHTRAYGREFAREALNKVGGGREGRVSEAVPSCTQRDVFCSLQRLERLPTDLFRASLAPLVGRLHEGGAPNTHSICALSAEGHCHVDSISVRQPRHRRNR
jgi:hypothetical protein